MADQIPYKCTSCGAEGVRLYRRYQTVAEHADLKCRPCSEDEQGKHEIGSSDGSQIGWRVAAVPTKDGETFWGYTSVPDERVAWWQALPDREGSLTIDEAFGKVAGR